MKQAVILAAGPGQRLQPFTVNRPKCMLSIAGRPIIQYVLESLAANGIRDVILVVGYQKEQIFDFLGDGSRFGTEIRYINQLQALGTAHALDQARGATDSQFLVLYGNRLISPETLAPLMNLTPPAILTKKVDNPSRYGVVSLEGDKVTGILEKPAHPAGSLVNVGIYLFDERIFAFTEADLDLPAAINQMIHHGETVKAIETQQTWLDVVYPWDILSFNSMVLESLPSCQNGIMESGVILQGKISLGRKTVIHANSYIMGPAIIGAGCEIGPNVCILPSTSIGDNVVVAPFCEITNSVIEDDTRIGSGSTIQDSVIDKGCAIGSHFCACSEKTEVRINGGYHQTKIGAMIGQACQIGNAVTIEAGAILGNYSQVKSLKLLRGNLPDRSLVV
jgi:UDP-N-acetylglucosamine diphosphorylase/glucosamine-1-phosphate N-acetyltransferase